MTKIKLEKVLSTVRFHHNYYGTESLQRAYSEMIVRNKEYDTALNVTEEYFNEQITELKLLEESMLNRFLEFMSDFDTVDLFMRRVSRKHNVYLSDLRKYLDKLYHDVSKGKQTIFDDIATLFSLHTATGTYELAFIREELFDKQFEISTRIYRASNGNIRRRMSDVTSKIYELNEEHNELKSKLLTDYYTYYKQIMQTTQTEE